MRSMVRRYSIVAGKITRDVNGVTLNELAEDIENSKYTQPEKDSMLIYLHIYQDAEHSYDEICREKEEKR